MCTIFFTNILQLFIKFAHSFVAIELLTFFNNAKKIFYCSRELSVFWLNKLYSLSRKGSIKKITLNIHQNLFIFLFRFFEVFNRGVKPKNIFRSFIKKSHISSLLSFFQLCSFLVFSFYSSHWHHWQGNWSLLEIYSIENIHPNTQETCFIIFSCSHTICK